MICLGDIDAVYDILSYCFVSVKDSHGLHSYKFNNTICVGMKLAQILSQQLQGTTK